MPENKNNPGVYIAFSQRYHLAGLVPDLRDKLGDIDSAMSQSGGNCDLTLAMKLCSEFYCMPEAEDYIKSYYKNLLVANGIPNEARLVDDIEKVLAHFCMSTTNQHSEVDIARMFYDILVETPNFQFPVSVMCCLKEHKSIIAKLVDIIIEEQAFDSALVKRALLPPKKLAYDKGIFAIVHVSPYALSPLTWLKDETGFIKRLKAYQESSQLTDNTENSEGHCPGCLELISLSNR